MKTFYTERDIEDMHAAGKTEIIVSDEVVLTDLARERALALGLTLTSGTQPPVSYPASPIPPTPVAAPQSQADTVSQIKARVIARLGTDSYNDLLDQIIPQVLAKLSQENTTPSVQDGY